MSDATFGLLLPFDRDDPEFARGFEAGRLWTLLRESPDEPLEATVSVLEMFSRRARLGWDTWGNEALGHFDGSTRQSAASPVPEEQP